MTEIMFLWNTDSEADFLNKSASKKCQSRVLASLSVPLLVTGECDGEFDNHLFIALVETDRWKFLRFYQNPIIHNVMGNLKMGNLSVARM